MPQQGEIISNELLKDSYRKVVFHVPDIAAATRPGQFVHVKIANLRDRLLRRPFSICDVGADGSLTVVYKVVGSGTEVLAELPAGTVCDVMGPLGNPFTVCGEDELPVIVAGGYGSAATYLLAQRSPVKGILLLGARSSDDLILTGEFRDAGFDVRVATNDGSQGHRGLVTELISGVVRENPNRKLRFYGCGPFGMLMALGRLLTRVGMDGELSLDHLMCCGVGACFACVVKVRDGGNADGWRYARTCKEGPVFMASQVYYPEEK